MTHATPLYAGLDIGTSGARAIAIDAQGNLQGSARSSMAEHDDDRRDPATWWAAAQSALTQLGNAIDVRTIQALAIDATSGTVLAVNSTGSPVAAALMYNDAVDDESILNAIAAVAPQQSAVHGASSGLARAISLQSSPGCEQLLHQADWIAGKLTGNFSVSDESNALKTGYDPIERCWPQWLAKTGIALSKLPQVVAAGTPTATVDPVVAKKLNFSADLQIVAGVTDGCASFLATGACETGDCVTALGSTITMKMLCDQPIFSPRFGIYSHRIGNQWLAGGASNSGGGVLEHFFSAQQIVQLSTELQTETDSGLNYYPLLKPGERFPHNDSNWQPKLTPRPPEDAQFLQGLLEGMAEIERLGYQRLHELGAPKPTTVRSVGGGASNLQWQRIRQRFNPVPFETSTSTEAAAGVARLARQAMMQSGP